MIYVLFDMSEEGIYVTYDTKLEGIESFLLSFG